MGRWTVERVVHFAPGDLAKDGFVHFGFHDQRGRHFLIDHGRHFLGLVGPDDQLVWTVAAQPVLPGVPNIEAALQFPMYVDSLPDGTLVVSNLGDARLYSVDPPISLAIDEAGNAFVGDRRNHVVRMIDHATGIITTIAGRPDADDRRPNDPGEVDPLRLNLPQISSMDDFDGRLLVPTDLDDGSGELAVLRMASRPA